MAALKTQKKDIEVAKGELIRKYSQEKQEHDETRQALADAREEVAIAQSKDKERRLLSLEEERNALQQRLVEARYAVKCLCDGFMVAMQGK